ncbi:flavodoxin family protein [Clostridium sp. JS66]|uniref:flavodoxin family protein n=1 Tax=Clostridium sp. JS66 TaxID=3064705 RepID=UPI00399B4F24
MKVIGISGSARKNGNTAILIQTVFKELEKRGIETELIQLFDKEIQGCKGCFACSGKGKCVIEKDTFNECFKKMIEADGIILGSPVYSADISSKMKAFLERSGVIISVNHGLIKYKVGASVAAVRRGGGMTAVDTLNHFLLIKRFYW